MLSADPTLSLLDLRVVKGLVQMLSRDRLQEPEVAIVASSRRTGYLPILKLRERLPSWKFAEPNSL